MSNHSKGNERRNEKRLELSLPVTFFNKKVKTKNVSAGDVDFEAKTNDIEHYWKRVYDMKFCERLKVYD